ncbi:MAG: DUF4230 domain-containing protein [Anaerolineae bacterium]|nr:DUF4230 domain-containing protein [Anaerolineae bacterium]
MMIAVAIGIIAFQFGQQATVANQTSIDPSERAALPVIVTNTPTQTSTPTATATPRPTSTSTPTPTPIVVITKIDSLGQLETTEYAMRTVIDLENEPSNLWERIAGSDKLMLLAEGEVIAGFDLTKVTEDDIVVDGTQVTLTLPPAEILRSRIDNERTQVYQRETGLFVKPDPTLESRARQLAEEALIEWAIERDIFDQAERDGRVQLENFLRSLGFTEITITVKEEEI